MMVALMETCTVVLQLSVLVKVVHDVNNREHCWCLEALSEAHPPLGEL